MVQFRNIIIYLFFLTTYSQNVKIVYEQQMKVSKESLKGIPESLREKFISQLQSVRLESTMVVQNSTIFYESKPLNKEIVSKGIQPVSQPPVGYSFIKDMSTNVSTKEMRGVKNIKTNTYTYKSRNKLKTLKLEAVMWKHTNRKKEVIGYHCYEMEAIFKNKLLRVFVTNELAFRASPSTLPVPKGVVLEYSYGPINCRATKIEMNQAPITSFF